MANPILNALQARSDLERKREYEQQLYAQQALQNMANNAGMANNASLGGAGGAGGAGYAGPTQQQLQQQLNGMMQSIYGAQTGTVTTATTTLRVDPNTHPLLAPNITTLADMWNLAFGTGWVSRKQMDALDPDWYRYALDRFKQRGMLETLALADGPYFRLVEQHGNR